IEIAGKTILRWTIEAFLQHPDIDAVQVVIAEDGRAQYAAATEGLSLLAPVIGGAERQASVWRGLEALLAHVPQYVLIHDAARPFVSGDLISRTLQALEAGAEAALPALSIADSLKSLGDGRIAGSLDRDRIVAAQTPQGFAFAPILAAHRAFAGEGLGDDTAVAERAGIEIVRIEGETGNIKITTPDDIATARQRIAGALTDVRTGFGFDVHAFTAGDGVWLGGIHIPHNAALKGHSDADVALHALTDALLGAIGAGDIGTYFPPSDTRWKGAPSDQFLTHAAGLIASR